MKPWLFDILACPIDKFFPLKLYIFSFETKSEEFNVFLDIYLKRDLTYINKEKVIEVSKKKDAMCIKDNITIEYYPIKSYLELIISSINELENIFNNTKNTKSKKCLNLIKTEIKQKITEFLNKNDFSNLNDILPELYFLNKIKVETEIESGLLFCDKCSRWYPIIDTIPQMLPDKYRDKNKEINFLKINKNLLDEEFFFQNLKPFNL
ncbi:MAG: Trm112 family protein [Candidatus Odinarchaeota archaeon]